MKSISMMALLFLFLSLFCCKQNDKNSESFIYDDPVEYPSFPGGIDSLLSFVKKNLKYPQGSLSCEGSIFVSFIVNEDGSLSNYKVVRGGCAEDYHKCAIEVFKKMPKWIPGKQNGSAVKVRCVYPVRFTMS